MRLPLGILSGVGFIGAGAILRKDGLVTRPDHGRHRCGFVTVIGLCAGGGQLALAALRHRARFRHPDRHEGARAAPAAQAARLGCRSDETAPAAQAEASARTAAMLERLDGLDCRIRRAGTQAQAESGALRRRFDLSWDRARPRTIRSSRRSHGVRARQRRLGRAGRSGSDGHGRRRAARRLLRAGLETWPLAACKYAAAGLHQLRLGLRCEAIHSMRRRPEPDPAAGGRPRGRHARPTRKHPLGFGRCELLLRDAGGPPRSFIVGGLASAAVGALRLKVHRSPVEHGGVVHRGAADLGRDRDHRAEGPSIGTIERRGRPGTLLRWMRRDRAARAAAGGDRGSPRRWAGSSPPLLAGVARARHRRAGLRRVRRHRRGPDPDGQRGLRDGKDQVADRRRIGAREHPARDAGLARAPARGGARDLAGGAALVGRARGGRAGGAAPASERQRAGAHHQRDRAGAARVVSARAGSTSSPSCTSTGVIRSEPPRPPAAQCAFATEAALAARGSPGSAAVAPLVCQPPPSAL